MIDNLHTREASTASELQDIFDEHLDAVEITWFGSSSEDLHIVGNLHGGYAYIEENAITSLGSFPSIITFVFPNRAPHVSIDNVRADSMTFILGDGCEEMSIAKSFIGEIKAHSMGYGVGEVIAISEFTLDDSFVDILDFDDIYVGWLYVKESEIKEKLAIGDAWTIPRVRMEGANMSDDLVKDIVKGNVPDGTNIVLPSGDFVKYHDRLFHKFEMLEKAASSSSSADPYEEADRYFDHPSYDEYHYAANRGSRRGR